jgi:hypothetical protein
VWGELLVEGDQVAVQLRGWRRVVSTKSGFRFSLASISRIEHDPLVRAHVRSGLRNWKRHGQGLWRIGVYHGIDGWSFWSIGMGRNAVLIECSGERFRYVVIEVADPVATVREISAAAARVTSRTPGGSDAALPAAAGRDEPQIPPRGPDAAGKREE